MANGTNTPIGRIIGGAQQVSNFIENQQLSPLRRRSAEVQARTQELGLDRAEAETGQFLDRVKRSDMTRAAFEFLQIPENDIAAQDSFLDNRIANLRTQGIDTQDTEGMFQLDPVARRQAAQNVVQTAQQFGDIQPGRSATGKTRQTATDVRGERRFLDTGKRAFPDVQAPERPTPREEFKFKQDEQKRLASKLSAGAERELFSAQTAAQESDTAVSELLSVAEEFESLPPGEPKGFAARVKGFVQEFLGTEDDVKRLRTRYNRIKNNRVMASLPPGVASDVDIKIAMSGFLKDTSNPKQVAAFFRGLAKMEKINGQFNTFKADWISTETNTKGMFKAWKEQLADESKAEEIKTQSDEDLLNF